MKDINRITKILGELERIWRANPEYRLRQLMVIASGPNKPCPTVFHMEDDVMLEGLLAFDTIIKDLK